MNRTETKQKLKEGLPSGFLAEIKRRLKAKGLTASSGKISQVCNPELSDWDLDIIEIATDLAEENKVKTLTEKAREESLTKRVKQI